MNGEELLTALETARVLPSLVLLDINMPIMDGLEALKIVRSNTQFNTLPIVIWTTSSHEVDRNRAFALGANGFITKPDTIQEYNRLVLDLRRNWLLGHCV
ncbi:hypothetical protein GCM10028804_55980 [Larkinella terrae]